MVDRNKNKSRPTGISHIVEPNDLSPEGSSDPWASIENGDAVAAREVFYREASPREQRVKHYEKFKKKRKRSSDGVKVVRMEVHPRIPRSTKRALVNGTAVESDSPSHRVPPEKLRRGDSDSKVNIFANLIKAKETATCSSHANTKKTAMRSSKTSTKRKHPYTADVAEIDENGDSLEVLESDESYDSSRNVDDPNEISDGEYIEGNEEQSVRDDEEEDLIRVVANEAVTSEEYSRFGEDDVTLKANESVSDESDEDEGDSDDDSDRTVMVFDLEDYYDFLDSKDQKAVVLHQLVRSGATLPPPPDFDSFPFTDNDSSITATRAFAWMITPCNVQKFFRDFFQNGALILKRKAPNYYGNLFSTQSFVEVVQNNYLEYGTNINIAKYKDGVRFTMNGSGRVYPNHLKEQIALGRSVQFVNPQTFVDRVWYLCEVLQEMFGCFIGANTYLTPPGSAGFAPHWDDIDAFLLQLEGKKYWKVYAPDSINEKLPRESSGNFTDDDMKNRKLTYEGWIEAGDLLYIPRGFIHQATTSDDVHSLHITISSGRHWSFADLMDKLVPEAVTTLAKNRWEMRKSLPVGMLDMGGVADTDYRLDELFEEKWKAVLESHLTVLQNSLKKVCDGGIDIMAREFMKTALPPMLTDEEKNLSVLGLRPDILHGKPMVFRPSTKVKLIRRHAQRLIFENEDDCYIVHRMANSRVYEGRPEQNFELPIEFVSGFNTLSANYPEWTSLSEMPSDMSGEEVQKLCHLLFYHGLIMVQQLPDRVKRNVVRQNSVNE